MDRTAYNECMKPYISGSGRSKQERTLSFCVGAKVCSGKAWSDEEAIGQCNAPRLPKWAKRSNDEPEQLSCPQRTQRAKTTIDQMLSGIREGAPDIEMAAQAINDIHACHKDSDVLAVAKEAFDGFKDIADRAYLKGEGAEVAKKLELVGALL